MRTFEMQKSIRLFFYEAEGFHSFITVLSKLSQLTEVMERDLTGIAQGGTLVSQWASQIHSHLSNVRQTTEEINNRQFFKALENFQRSVVQIQPTNITTSKLITNLNREVEDFASLYDRFLSRQSGENALPLILAAKVLSAKITTLFDVLQLIDESVGSYDVPSSSEAPLAILLPAHLDLAAFASRLLAIQDLYTELCMLLSVSESTHPLRISKIESGSLWAKLFGESRVIGLMVSFIENTASWIFRTYTNEGKIASIPRKVEAIDSLLRLKEQLTEAGVDTSNMKEHIEKSAVAISKSLAEILDGQSSVTINEQTISVGSEINKALLEVTTPLQLQGLDLKTRHESPALPSPK